MEKTAKFKGNLSSVGLPKLLHDIYMEADSFGVLELSHESVKKRFYFKDGLPSFAVSNVLNEVLGRLLMEEGVITEAVYKSSLETVIKQKRRHGEVLISMGLLTEEKINEFLEVQLRKRIWKAMAWKEADYVYSKVDALSSVFVQFPQNTATIIIDGLSLGYFPVTRIHAALTPHMNKALPAAVNTDKYRIADLKLNLQETRFIEKFDGERMTSKIIENSDLLFSRTLAIVYTLIVTGLIKTEEGQKPDRGIFDRAESPGNAPYGEAVKTGEEISIEARLAAELLFVKARTAINHGDYSSAVSMLEEITRLNREEGEYLAYLAWAAYLMNPAERGRPEIMLQDALRLNKDNAISWHFLGKIRLSSGNYSGAKEAFEKALGVNRWMLESLFEIKFADMKKGEASPSAQKAAKELSGATEYFSFSSNPFSEDPDPVNFLRTVAIEDILDLIANSIRKSPAPNMLIGEKGAGKTTFALELLLKLKDDKVMCAFLPTPPPFEKSLLKAINAEIGAESGKTDSSTKEDLSALAVAVTRNKSIGGTTLVIVDEAHRLKDADLLLIQELSRLDTIRFLLVGEPALTEKIEKDDLKELRSRIGRYELKPFTNEETARYISIKLGSVVKSDVDAPDAVFSGDAIWTIFGESRGIPGRINECCRRLLAAAARYKSSSIDRDVAHSVYSEAAMISKEPEQVWDMTPPAAQAPEPEKTVEPVVAPQLIEEPAKSAKPAKEVSIQSAAPRVNAPVRTYTDLRSAPHEEQNIKIDFKSIKKEIEEEKRTDKRTEVQVPQPGRQSSSSAGLVIAILAIAALGALAWYFFLR